jgi:uncharacterized Zn finger protein
VNSYRLSRRLNDMEVTFKCPYCGSKVTLETAVDKAYNVYQESSSEGPFPPIVATDLVPMHPVVVCPNCGRVLLCDLICKLLVS